MIEISFLKTGNIASSLVAELALDERADREDIRVRVFSSGAKMSEKAAESVANLLIKNTSPDLIIYATPNANAKGPRKAINVLKKADMKNIIVISDYAGAGIKEELEEAGFGYIFVKPDSMIGARREFLDPCEMAIFNADILKTFAICGVIRAIQSEIDKAINAVKRNKSYLPRIIVDSKLAVEHANFANPYAKTKAIAALEILEKAGEVSVRACFVEKERKSYISLASSSHEIVRIAAKLSDEAREMEKAKDSVFRAPHYKDGRILSKRKLFEKPE